jgi:hypothetical protein
VLGFLHARCQAVGRACPASMSAGLQVILSLIGVSPGTGQGITLLHVRAPPGCPRSVASLKALRCLAPLPQRWPLYFRQDTPGPLPDIEFVESCKSGGITYVSRILDLVFVLGVALSEAQDGGVALRKYKGQRRRRTEDSVAL